MTNTPTDGTYSVVPGDVTAWVWRRSLNEPQPNPPTEKLDAE